MATKAERDLEDELGPSPHPLFEDREKPWEDAELMLRLQDEHDYQYEIAHLLGCKPSRISYWMDKAEEGWEPSVAEETECLHFDVCGYQSPSNSANRICNTCIDIMRFNDKQDDPIRPADIDGMQAYITALYEEYDKFEVNSP
jgi:hypothetical protein